MDGLCVCGGELSKKEDAQEKEEKMSHVSIVKKGSEFSIANFQFSIFLKDLLLFSND
jgi:hypothetical protein